MLVEIWSTIYYRDHLEFFEFYLNALILMGIKHTHLLGIFLELTYFISYFCFCLSRSLDDVKSMDFLSGFVQRRDRW